MEKMRKSYTKPITELTQMEKAPFVMVSVGGTNDDAGNGGIIGGESKISFSWTFQEREGIESNYLDNSWD
ncbi:MAG: hypothetical protein IJ605_00670 [Prevotella sp.]|nr:hypothetical protein [Prevotella sp.]